MRLKIRYLFPVLLIIFLFSGCGKEEIKEEPIRRVKVVRVTDCSEFKGRTFPGRAEAVQEVNLGFEVGGSLIERPVDKGDEVKEGDLLVQLDPRDFKNALAAAKAELERSKAHRDRISEALKFNAVAEQELTDAEAGLAAADARVKIRQKAMDDSRINAPFTGIVSETYAENYQRVQPKEKVLRLLDISKIKFTVDISENLISYIPNLKDTVVEFDAFSGKKVPAVIEEVGTEASLTTRTYPVTLIMDQPKDFKILPGMAGKVSGKSDLAAGKDPTVPTPAVFNIGEGYKSYVWIVDEDGMTVKLREVVPGEIVSCGLRVKGVRLGELVVAAGVQSLKEGQKVSFEKPRNTAEEE